MYAQAWPGTYDGWRGQQMRRAKVPVRVKVYVHGIIGAGLIAALVSAVAYRATTDPLLLVTCAAIAALSGMLKLRLPGMEGTYSPTFLPILIAVLRLQWPETLLIGGIAGLAQSYVNTPRRPTVLQALFNVANMYLSISVAYLIRAALAEFGVTTSVPAALCLIAATYFVVNTYIV